MKGFFSALWENLRCFWPHVRQGLRPGIRQGVESNAQRLRRNFIYHLHPLQVSERALRPMATMGLGIITLTLFLVLSVTGFLLMIYYVPSTQEAYRSMQDIQFAQTFGPLMRSLHRFAAHAMVVCVLLHLVRILATGSYLRRELNWFLGLSLMALTLGLAFTGYLLPWDQRSFWAVSVSSAMMDHVPLLGGAIKKLTIGGDVVNQSTLVRFYMLHVALLPGALTVILAFHLWRIRKDGGLLVSGMGPGEPKTVPAWPHLVLREALVVFAVLVVLGLFSLWMDAPLGAPLDPHAPSNPEKAPWYFLWVQEMVSYSAPVGGFVFPGLLFLGLMLLPFLEREEAGAGQWFGGNSCRRTVGITLLVALAAFLLFEFLYLQAESGPGVGAADRWLWDVLNPASGMAGLALLVFWITGLVCKSTRAGFLCWVVVMLVAVVGCTVMGLCRGPDWVFYWPWEDWPLAY